jgi:hypothetical protein
MCCQNFANLWQEHFFINGLMQAGVGTQVFDSTKKCSAQEFRYSEYLDVRKFSTNGTDQFDAIFLWHTYIENDQIEEAIYNSLPGFSSVCRFRNQISGFFQGAAKADAGFCVIIYNQNRGHIWAGSFLLRQLPTTSDWLRV